MAHAGLSEAVGGEVAQPPHRRSRLASIEHALGMLVELPAALLVVAEIIILFADPTTQYFRIFEVMRDYGMYERTEAPQYYPPVERAS